MRILLYAEERRRILTRHLVELSIAHAQLAEPLDERHEAVDRQVERRRPHVAGQDRVIGADRLDGGRHLLDAGASPRLKARDARLWAEIDADVDRKSTRLNSSHITISY